MYIKIWIIIICVWKSFWLNNQKKKGKNDKKMYFKIRFGHAIGKTKTYGLIMFESRTGFIWILVGNPCVCTGHL